MTLALTQARQALQFVLEADGPDDTRDALEVLVYEGRTADVVASLASSSGPWGARAASVQETVYRPTNSAPFASGVSGAFAWVQLLLELRRRVFRLSGVPDDAAFKSPPCIFAPEVEYALFREEYSYLCAAALLVCIRDSPNPGWREFLLVDEMKSSLRDPLHLFASVLPEEGEAGRLGKNVLRSIERRPLDIAKMADLSARAAVSIQALAGSGRRADIDACGSRKAHHPG